MDKNDNITADVNGVAETVLDKVYSNISESVSEYINAMTDDADTNDEAAARLNVVASIASRLAATETDVVKKAIFSVIIDYAETMAEHEESPYGN